LRNDHFHGGVVLVEGDLKALEEEPSLNTMNSLANIGVEVDVILGRVWEGIGDLDGLALGLLEDLGLVVDVAIALLSKVANQGACEGRLLGLLQRKGGASGADHGTVDILVGGATARAW
jgi:hypothetical protein